MTQSSASSGFNHKAQFVISHSFVLMYADDVKLFLSCSEYNCQRLLQEDLVALETWCEYNYIYIYLARTPEIGQGLGRILSCGARKP